MTKPDIFRGLARTLCMSDGNNTDDVIGDTGSDALWKLYVPAAKAALIYLSRVTEDIELLSYVPADPYGDAS